MKFKTVNVGGLKTACLSRAGLVNLIVSRITESKSAGSYGRPFVISSVNGHSISLYNRNERTRMLLDDADLLHADGQSVVSMARHFLAGAIPERSATTDMFTDIATVPDVCLRHYLLGGEDAAVSKCSRIMEAKYERFSCVGTHHGYFDEWEVENVIKEINDSGADILWVGLGKPKEQEFVYAHRDKINVPIIITCGGCYNYVTGDYRRAPLWIQKAGFEWLHRALTEPRKLLFRYVTTSPHAIYCVLRHRFRKH